MLERMVRKDRTEATFVLPDDTPPGQVSVVGDFDGWQPGVHTQGRETRRHGRATQREDPFLPLRGRRGLRVQRRERDQDGHNSLLHT